jgi:hypothetical protein
MLLENVRPPVIVAMRTPPPVTDATITGPPVIVNVKVTLDAETPVEESEAESASLIAAEVVHAAVWIAVAAKASARAPEKIAVETSESEAVSASVRALEKTAATVSLSTAVRASSLVTL